MEKIIIDTDPGIDDAMAVLFACLHPDIELMGLTSIFGNVTTDIATRNALALLEMAGAEHLPVARGATRPLVQPAKAVAAEVHGVEGFGNVPPMTPKAAPLSESAADFICRMVNRHPGEITLCPVGPFTNIALALRRDPSIAAKVKGVTVMGGSLEEGGNVTDHAEANVWQDPHAAAAVFAADWPVTMIGLDVTHQIVCTPEHFAALVGPAPKLGGFLNDAAQFYFAFHEKAEGIYGCHMHDPTAVVSIIRPDLFGARDCVLDVVVDGERVGETVAVTDRRGPATKVCMTVEVDAVRDLFYSTIKTGF